MRDKKEKKKRRRRRRESYKNVGKKTFIRIKKKGRKKSTKIKITYKYFGEEMINYKKLLNCETMPDIIRCAVQYSVS